MDAERRTSDLNGGGLSLGDLLAVMRRRRWVLLCPLVVLPVVVAIASSAQPARFRAAANVWINRQNLAAGLTGTPQPDVFQSDPERLMQTQAALARSPAVAQRVITAIPGAHLSAQSFLEDSQVDISTGADILEFSATSRSPALARTLATQYAREFSDYRRKLDTVALDQERRGLLQRLADLRARGRRRSPVYTTVLEKEVQVSTQAALQASNATVVAGPLKTTQVQPQTLRDALLGLLGGLLLGGVLAASVEALDRRPRSGQELARRLGVPLLGRLDKPGVADRLRGGIRRRAGLALIERPGSSRAEAVRMLRAGISLALEGSSGRVLMVTSAIAGEGKTTTAANLALAFAQTGRHVTAIELDVSKPRLASRLGLATAPSVADLGHGDGDLERVLQELPPTGLAATNGGGGANGSAAGAAGAHVGRVELLAGGSEAAPGECDALIENGLAATIGRVRERADLVLIDAPSLLETSAALALSARVDGILLVADCSRMRPGTVTELRSLLERSPTPVVGLVAVNAERDRG
jgi:Mrp family chromosome partitioning ATPase/capsular polysaccharide biosynthesis protein